MAQLSTNHLSELVIKRILQFFNNAFQAEQIQHIKPLLDSDSEYWIGDIVAQRIIDHKRSLPRRRFESLSQLNDIQGFGQDKLDNLAELVQKSSAISFKERLRAEVLPSNFPVDFAQVNFRDEESFNQIASNISNIQSAISKKIEEILFASSNDYRFSKLGANYVGKSYADRILPEYLAPYELTTWFYAFDADNWFSYDRALQVCREYLDGQSFNTAHRELVIFRGFPTGLVIAPGGITPDNLPVVLDYEELHITIWWAQLFD